MSSRSTDLALGVVVVVVVYRLFCISSTDGHCTKVVRRRSDPTNPTVD